LEIINVTPQKLINAVSEQKEKNARLVAITASLKENTEISYSFDCDGEHTVIRISITNEGIESITKLYPYAFLYENEIKELFAVKIKGISLDFDGTLYKTAKKAAFNPNYKEEEPKKDKKVGEKNSNPKNKGIKEKTEEDKKVGEKNSNPKNKNIKEKTEEEKKEKKEGKKGGKK
jgi:ech hydrogenase subunit D